MWRVVWQFSLSLVGAVSTPPSSTAALKAAASRHFAGLKLNGEIEPVFLGHPARIRSTLLALLPGSLTDPILDLSSYYHAYLPSRTDAEAAVRQLRRDPHVRYAEVQPPLAKPVKFSQRRKASEEVAGESFPVGPSPNLTAEQGYLDDAPRGIDARSSWRQPGGRGAGIRVIDVESGWNFQHEVLVQNHGGVIFGETSDDDHGTAVLGIFGGNDVHYGVEGIAPDAFTYASSALWDEQNHKWNAAAAIQAAADRLSAGDVILLEMHAPGPNAPGENEEQKGYIAIEYWDAEFAAIAYATAKGIYVVEAGGNGGEDLDARIYAGRFDRKVRDSGAILVGGGHAPPDANPRSRIWWSNYGSRLDLQGWGEYIVTSGGLSDDFYHDRYTGTDESHCYTQSFGGTSGASPIVVGAVACLSAAIKAAARPAFSPQAMRALLSTTGSAQTASAQSPASQHIGPLPSIKQALQQLRLT